MVRFSVIFFIGDIVCVGGEILGFSFSFEFSLLILSLPILWLYYTEGELYGDSFN